MAELELLKKANEDLQAKLDDLSEQKISASQIQAVTIKAPTFSEANPNRFFSVLEAQFKLKGISVTSTRFYHALTALPEEVLNLLSDTTVAAESYEQLKNFVVGYYEKSKPELFEKLISTATLTGKPSNTLRQMENIANKIGVCDELLRHKFVQNLPTTIAPTIAAQTELSLDKLGAMADDLILLHNKMSVNAVSNSPHTSFKSQNAGTFEKKSVPYGVRPYHENQRPKICRAHLYYGEKARTCKNWCVFPNKTTCKIMPSSRPSSRSSSPAPSGN